jgi:hypothetical protein
MGETCWRRNLELQWFASLLQKGRNHHDPNGAPEQYGFDGPMHTCTISCSHPDQKYSLRDMMKNAWARPGFEYKKDGNDGKPLGMSEAVENWRDGMRQHASKAYDLSGVDIMYNNIVHRIQLKERRPLVSNWWE